MTFYQVANTSRGEVFTPLPDSASRWTGSHVRGPAITSLLARAVERAVPEEARLLPARSTFDLHSQVPMTATQVRTRVLKQGRTLWVVEAEMYIGDDSSERVVARARVALAAPNGGDVAAETPLSVWSTPLPPGCVPPSNDLLSVSEQGRLYRAEHTEWSGTRAGHQNADQHHVWYFDVPIIEGETPTPYQRAARISDLGNFVVNFGAEGLAYINADVTLSLARLPAAGGVGVTSQLRTANAGVSVGTALVFDAEGMCGMSTVTAVRHTKTQLSYS